MLKELLAEKGLAIMTGREAFGQTLLRLGQYSDRIVALGSDAIESTNCILFQQKYPDRTFNFGIAESNMVSAAAGLAIVGNIPVVAAYGFLLSMRCAEQVRTDICYPNLNVKLVATASGLSMGPGGPTHHCLEDLAILRSFPNMTIVSTSSNMQTIAATYSCILEHNGPVYLRLIRGTTPEIYQSESFDFRIGKANLLRDGNDATLIATGEAVYLAIRAAEELAKDDIWVRVIDMHTLKPIDEEMIRRAAEETRAIISLEEHNTIGGLGEAISSVVCEKDLKIPVHKIGIHDKFCEVGSTEEIWCHHGLSIENIMERVREMVK
jgi:transketolase